MRSGKIFTRRLSIRFKEEDYQDLKAGLKNSTCQSMVEYLRKRVLGRPITMYYRNKSLDDFTETCIQFNKKIDVIILQGMLNDNDQDWLIQEIKSIRENIINTYDHASNNPYR